MPENTTLNLEKGNSRMLPEIIHAAQIQVNVGDEFVKKSLNKNANDAQIVQIMDMCYFSATMPDPICNEIIRRNCLGYCEQILEENNVLCLTGEDGVGVTTILCQFAKEHSCNCVSYFNNGLENIRLTPDVIEQSIFDQLYWFAFGDEAKPKGNTNIDSIYNIVLRKLKQSNKPLYFIFDGFYDIPSEKVDGLKRLFSKLLWDKGRFIFSGKPDNIKQLCPEKVNLKICQNEIMRFGEAEVREYFRILLPALEDVGLNQLYDITKGNAHRMDFIRCNYIRKDRLKELFNSEITGESDLYDEDFSNLFKEDNNIVEQLFTLLAYAEFPLYVSLISQFLQTNDSYIIDIVNKYKDYITKNEHDILRLKSEGFHKYLRKKMTSLKQQVELRVIDVLENQKNPLDFCNYLPEIYKSTNKAEKLINYLNTGNVQQILVNKQSQAALNEQCDFGYDACLNHIEKNLKNIFRFALNKSTSREIEKNELWDNEIEALLAVGQYEQAIALAQNIYLTEERLKSYLLIVKKKKELSEANYSVLKDNISQLVKIIDFENIPDKAVELAKLLIPVDYEATTDIIDRITKKNKDISNSDNLYAMLSLTCNNDDEGNVTNFDLVNSKIQDSSLRIFAHTAKNLFTDVDVDYFLSELSKLPNNSQRLYLLQFWLPEHENMLNVGKAVLEGIKLIVAESDTEMPKAKVLNKICSSMQKMNNEEMQKAMVYIESMGESIKYPTFDYIDMELTIIESIKEELSEKAKSRLENLYLYIIGLEDDSIRTTCFAKFLGKYEKLGNKKEIEKTIISTIELRKEIIDGIDKLLSDTAYHIKVLEGPIKALVCSYPTMIDEMITNTNTNERKSRAYSYAASQYLLQEKRKIDLDYFFKLLSKAEDIYSDRLNPLTLLSEMLVSVDNLDHTSLLPPIKKNFNFIEKIESAKNKCVICMRIYLWLRKNFPFETFADNAKRILLASWESIDIVWFKIEIGFFMAKNFAKISKEDANEIIIKCRDIKKQSFLASSSCVASYREAFNLYSLSLCNLIKLDLCDDKKLQEYSEDIDSLLSKSELTSTWSNIALEFYLANNINKFNLIVDKYFPCDYSQFSAFDQKCIIYQISPALFIRSQTKFFALFLNYDETFKNDCLLHICNFIITKQTIMMDVNPEHNGYELSFNDYNNLLVLLEQSSNDENFFNVVDIVCKSLKVTNQKYTLSTEQKQTIINYAKSIVEKNLPTKHGIQHDGYKIACLAALSNVNNSFKSKDMETWKSKIDAISNKSDRAFLYFLIAPYFVKRSDQQKFFEEGIAISETINSTFDKVNRLDMGISECIDYNLGTLIPNVAKSAMKSLANNGTLEEHKRLIDMVYQHKPELAEQLVNTLDQDIARIHYKSRLQKHIASVKKLAKVKKEMDTIENLDKAEQMNFFENQLDNLMKGKGQLQEISKVFSLAIKHIYGNNIIDAKAAIVYLMETISKKQKQSKNQKDLLFSIHQTTRYNLKLVLSLAAGTKDSLERIENMIHDHKFENDGFIATGERSKAVTFLLTWYRKTNINKLIIIDPYFSPNDLQLMKQLSDLNSNLNIEVLAHKNKFQSDDYTIQWNHLSAGIKCPIKIYFISYKGKPEDGPLHDRYWICSDDEHDKYFGIKLNSINGLGNKESSITSIDNAMSKTVLYNYFQYVHTKLPKKNGQELEYNEVVLK